MSSLEADYDSPPTALSYSAPPVIITITLGMLVCFFVGFCFLYLCRCCYMNVLHTWAFQRTASGTLARLSANTSPRRGLDPSLLQIFPTFPYDSVKERSGKKCGLECAICLLEFEDHSMLRLLTVCCHVFHQECIDLWLSSHKTCPVCRTDLDSPTDQIQKFQEICETHHIEEISRVSLTDNEIHIEVRGDKDEGDGDEGASERHKEVSMSQQWGEEEKKFARSHSTGHSIILIRGEDDEKDDKYTLRLPEQIEVKIIRRGHNYTRSCTTYKEMAMPSLCSKCSFDTARNDTEMV